jgi:hypothetical protein
MSGRSKSRKQGQDSPLSTSIDNAGQTSAESIAIQQRGFEMVLENFDTLSKRIESLETQHTNTTEIPTVSVSQTETSSVRPNVYVMQPDIAKPYFKGREDPNPMKFIARFRRYINIVNAHDRVFDIAMECLPKSARTMMEFRSKYWETLDEFEREFRRIYWSEQRQQTALYKLMNESYNPYGELGMSEHFATQMEIVSSLTIPTDEKILVIWLMRHFSENVQQLWFTSNNEANLNTAFEFLTKIDLNVRSNSCNSAINQVSHVNYKSQEQLQRLHSHDTRGDKRKTNRRPRWTKRLWREQRGY